ncbi:MAG: hypothetical protein SO072_03335 [Dysosmobacter sp.]|nr:hypothetical protein [Dysosmobacter sp.]
MLYTRIWGSISLLIGAVIAVLALVRGAWQFWLLLAVFAVWGLWLVLTILLPYVVSRQRQRKAQQLAEVQPPPASGGTRENDAMEQILLRHVNHRISAYLKSVYPKARWEWREQQPERLILEGGTGRIRIYGVPDYNFADVKLDAQANLQCSLVKIVPLAKGGKPAGESGPSSPNEQPVDPRIWFENQGRTVLESLVSDLNSRGHSSLEIDEDGAIHVESADGNTKAHEPLPSFPEKVYWPQLVNVLESEGYAAEVRENTVAVTW